VETGVLDRPHLSVREVRAERATAGLPQVDDSLRKGFVWGIGASVLVILLFSTRAVFVFGVPPSLPHSFDDWLNIVILVGVLEEIPFRGLVYQQLQAWLGFWPAALLSSVLFVSIHIPLRLATSDKLFQVAPAARIVTVFGLGVALCYLLKRSGSLWSCILLHSSYDLTSFF
jgi:uncharacterized protein